MGLTVVTPATTRPVSLADAKAWARVEASGHDGLIDDLIDQACAKVEELTGRMLGEVEFRLSLDAFSDAIELPRGPVSEVSAVGYIDTAGAPQTVDAGDWTLDLASTPQWVVRNADATWPEVLDAVNVVTVDFVAGYTEATVPASLRRAVMTLVARWYDNPGDTDVPASVLDAVQPFRTLWICA